MAKIKFPKIKTNSAEDKERIRKARLANGVTFQTEETDRQDGRILVASGTRSRNRDYWTGKAYRLVPSGMRFDAWAKTGLVLFMHNFNVPLGRSSMFLEGGQLFAPDSIDFHKRVVPIATNNWIGDAVGEFDTSVIADLWDQRYLNSVSIHVMFTQEDEENIVELEDEILIPTSEVIEFSVVTIPGDREANREKMLSMGLNSDLVECLVCDDGEKHQGGLVEPGKMYRISSDLLLPDGGKIKGTKLSSTTTDIPNPEVTMEPKEQDVDVAEEEKPEVAEIVEEAPFVAVELELEEEVEEDLQIDTLELAEAIAQDRQALLVLAQAFAATPEVISVFFEALKINAETFTQVLEAPAMARTKIRFVNSRQQAAPQPRPVEGVQEEIQTTTLIPEAQPPEPVFAPRDPKRRRAVLGLVR